MNVDTTATSRLTLYFGLLGGAIAWTLHLLLAYLIAEFGCIANLGERMLWNVTVVAWLIIGASIVTLLLAIAATVAAWWALGWLRDRGPSLQRDADAHLAQLGVITSGIFVLVIVFQTLPIFFYLRHC